MTDETERLETSSTYGKLTPPDDTEVAPEVDEDDEPDGWAILERLKELEADVDSSIGQLRRQVDDLLRRVMILESNKSD